jgi:hypothetical protein
MDFDNYIEKHTHSTSDLKYLPYYRYNTIPEMNILNLVDCTLNVYSCTNNVSPTPKRIRHGSRIPYIVFHSFVNSKSGEYENKTKLNKLILTLHAIT